MDHAVLRYRNHRGSRVFSEWPTRDGLRPIQLGRLSRFRSWELLSCRKRAARSFNPRSGPLHLDGISWNTACLNPCGSSFQCATTLCPKLRRISSEAYRELVSGTAARAPPSFSQFESTLELSYRSRPGDFTVLGPLHVTAARRVRPHSQIASEAGRHPCDSGFHEILHKNYCPRSRGLKDDAPESDRGNAAQW